MLDLCDPQDIIKELIWEELDEVLDREPTAEDFSKVVDELPELVNPEDVKRIVRDLFSRTKGR